MKSSVSTLDKSGEDALLMKVVQHGEDVTLKTGHRYQLWCVVTRYLRLPCQDETTIFLRLK